MTCRALAPALLSLLPSLTSARLSQPSPAPPRWHLRTKTAIALCAALCALQPALSAAFSAAQLWPCATIHAYPTHRPLGRVMRHAWESLILVATLWAIGTPPLEALPPVL